jgi:hypothetical protein
MLERDENRVSGRKILHAAISGATSGDNTLVAAVAGKKIKVIGLFLVTAGAVTVRFESGAGGTALTGVMSMAANGVLTIPMTMDINCPWFQTADGALLNMELGGAVQVSGAIVYYIE